jgi:DNA-binding transcriptional regulator YhcF (GntR family)
MTAMPVDPNSPVPIYQQIADHVRRAVAAGVHRPGEPIPSLRALAVELVVNPNTVQRAFEELEREGLVQARKGLGMFVTEDGVAAARSRLVAGASAAFTSLLASDLAEVGAMLKPRLGRLKTLAHHCKRELSGGNRRVWIPHL